MKDWKTTSYFLEQLVLRKLEFTIQAVQARKFWKSSKISKGKSVGKYFKVFLAGYSIDELQNKPNYFRDEICEILYSSMPDNQATNS